MLNLDLEDFFPSINFGRVRGMFMAIPYKRNATIATILAQICCFDNQLPQGAPTSPIVTNMICAKMDSQLVRLAEECKTDYTRYADDITFSTNLREFHPDLVADSNLDQFELGPKLLDIIHSNGFEVNDKKTRFRTRNQHQEVTGITVNKFPNVPRKFVRQIRAMLHSWEAIGLESAQEKFRQSFDKKHRSYWTQNPSFKRVVKGKIEYLGMVRGHTDRIYLGLSSRLQALAPELVKLPIDLVRSQNSNLVKVRILTEGKSDWKHLKSAFRALYASGRKLPFELQLDESEIEMGDIDLLKLCNTMAKVTQPIPTIFMFDRDNLNRIKDALGQTADYKSWGNNTYSFSIPVPPHRSDTPNISIEFYYSDDDIKRNDTEGRRLYFNSEFQNWGRHKTLKLNCYELNKIKNPNLCIIDSQVRSDEGKSMALSKDDFARHVLNQDEGFADLDFSEFAHIFRVINNIVKSHKN